MRSKIQKNPHWLPVALAIAFGVAARAQSGIGADSRGVPIFLVEGHPFHAAGVNVLSSHLGPPYKSFSMFDESLFDATQLDRNFKAIESLGYNYVRLWLKGYDPDAGFSLLRPGVGEKYIENIECALSLARSHHLHVVLTGSFREGLWVPKNYVPVKLPSEQEVGGMNRILLIPAMARSLGDFYAELLRSLQRRNQSVLSTLLYFDLYNELHFDLSKPPFDRNDGAFSFDGRSYDLSIHSDRQALMDAATRAWVRTVAASVHHVAATVLVTTSTFPIAVFGHTGFDGGLRSAAVKHEDPYPVRPRVLLEAGAQLLDIHIYSAPAQGASPSFDLKVRKILGEGEFTPQLATRVPIVFGEFGSKDLTMEHPESSIPEMLATFSALCALNPSGYALWALNGDIRKQSTGEIELLRNFGAASPICPGR